MDSCISFDTIDPFVRFAGEMSISEPRRLAYSYDHRLFYITGGTGILEMEGTSRKIRQGDLLYWMSGTGYGLAPAEGTVLEALVLNFDFTHGHSAAVRFLPMVSPEEYEPEKRLEILQFTDSPAMNGPVILHGLPAVLPYLRTIRTELSTPDNFSDFQMAGLLGIVLNLIRRRLSQRQSAREEHGPLQQLLAYLHAHYAQELDNRTLARKFGYHPNYVNQLIVEHTGISLHQYLLQLRLRQALELLQTTGLPVHQIAARVGFKNTSYFSQYFKKCTGYPPSAFRVQ